MRRQRGVPSKDREDRLHPAETLARIGLWFLENVDDDKLPTLASSPTPGADGQAAFVFRSNLYPDEALGAAARQPDSPEQLASRFAFGHMMEASKAPHERKRCKECAASDVIAMLRMHAAEQPPWDEELPFLKQIEDLVQQIDLLREAARQKTERLRAWAATPVAPVHGVHLSRSVPPSVDTCERMNRVRGHRERASARPQVAALQRDQRRRDSSPHDGRVAAHPVPSLLGAGQGGRSCRRREESA